MANDEVSKQDIIDAVLPHELGTAKADGYAGHFVLGHRCAFRLHHHILSLGGQRYRVSTVGQVLDGDKYREVNVVSMFETHVYEEDGDGNVVDWSPVHARNSKDSVAAMNTHYEFVEAYTNQKTGE